MGRKEVRKKAKKLKELLELTQTLKEPELKILFQHMSEDSLFSIFDAVFNCISQSGSIVPSTEQLKARPELLKHKCALRYMINPKRPLEKRREKLIQIGGGFGVIASLLIPLITSLIK